MKRILKLILKGAAVFLLVTYVLMGLSYAIRVAKIEINRQQSLSTLQNVIREAVDSNKPQDVATWIRMRPVTETEAITDIIIPNSGALEAGTFITLSLRNLRIDKPEDALFWLQMARYRMRFDALRCQAGAAAPSYEALLAAMTPAQIDRLLVKHPELVKKSVQRVMDFDAKYPAANAPDYTCKMLGDIARHPLAPIPREKWEAVRKSLRISTLSALRQMK